MHAGPDTTSVEALVTVALLGNTTQALDESIQAASAAAPGSTKGVPGILLATTALQGNTNHTLGTAAVSAADLGSTKVIRGAQGASLVLRATTSQTLAIAAALAATQVSIRAALDSQYVSLAPQVSIRVALDSQVATDVLPGKSRTRTITIVRLAGPAIMSVRVRAMTAGLANIPQAPARVIVSTAARASTAVLDSQAAKGAKSASTSPVPAILLASLAARASSLPAKEAATGAASVNQGSIRRTSTKVTASIALPGSTGQRLITRAAPDVSTAPTAGRAAGVRNEVRHRRCSLTMRTVEDRLPQSG